MKYFSWILVALFAVSAEAAILELSGSPEMIEAADVKVPIYPLAKLKLSGGSPTDVLKLTGSGVRKKSILRVSVYVAASYIKDPSSLTGMEPLAKLPSGMPRAIQLTFVRNVTEEQMRSGFIEALKENKVDVETPAIKSLLAGIKGPLAEKTQMTLVGFGKGGLDTLFIDFPGGTVSAKGKDLALDFWKIWFGKSADGGLEDLKAQLVSGKAAAKG